MLYFFAFCEGAVRPGRVCAMHACREIGSSALFVRVWLAVRKGQSTQGAFSYEVAMPLQVCINALAPCLPQAF